MEALSVLILSSFYILLRFFLSPDTLHSRFPSASMGEGGPSFSPRSLPHLFTHHLNSCPFLVSSRKQTHQWALRIQRSTDPFLFSGRVPPFFAAQHAAGIAFPPSAHLGPGQPSCREHFTLFLHRLPVFPAATGSPAIVLLEKCSSTTIFFPGIGQQ